MKRASVSTIMAILGRLLCFASIKFVCLILFVSRLQLNLTGHQTSALSTQEAQLRFPLSKGEGEVLVVLLS